MNRKWSTVNKNRAEVLVEIGGVPVTFATVNTGSAVAFSVPEVAGVPVKGATFGRIGVSTNGKIAFMRNTEFFGPRSSIRETRIGAFIERDPQGRIAEVERLEWNANLATLGLREPHAPGPDGLCSCEYCRGYRAGRIAIQLPIQLQS